MKLLLIAPSKSSFVMKDKELLSSEYQMSFHTCWSLSQIFKSLEATFANDVCLFWFASIRFIPAFLLAKLLRKPVFIITGGYDVSHLEDQEYGGAKPTGITSYARKQMLQNADKIITVSNSNTKEAIENSQVDIKKVIRIYLGIDAPQLQLTSWANRKQQIVFIGCCDSTSYKIKGFEVFLQLAKALPDYQFVHIGKVSVSEFQSKCYEVKNIQLMGYIEHMSPLFSRVLNDSKIILLPSKIEGFGASVVEGALHGCVPVVSNQFALPEVVGDMGKVCELKDVESFRVSIEEIMNEQHSPEELQKYYSERFSSLERKKSLISVINSSRRL